MPIHYIVTVGTSLLESPCFLNINLFQSLVQKHERFSLKQKDQVKRKILEFLSEQGDDIDNFLKKYPFNKDLWGKNSYHFLGAELATLRKIDVIKQELKSNDHIYLMATTHSSVAGQCSLLLKPILETLLPNGIKISIDFTDALDIKKPTSFTRGLEEIRKKVQNIIARTNENEKAFLVLSGGYKIVAMTLAQLQIGDNSHRITTVTLHEEGSEKLIRLISPAPSTDHGENQNIWPMPEVEGDLGP